MKSVTRLFLFLILFLIVTTNFVSATSYANIEPEEVLERAEVIVFGQYNFSSEPVPSEMMIHGGFEFEVDDVFRGDPLEQLAVGIDMNDLEWAKEFQQKKGKFLLFLEMDTTFADFLIPVGGPNGMVMLEAGKVPAGDKQSLLNLLKNDADSKVNTPLTEKEEHPTESDNKTITEEKDNLGNSSNSEISNSTDDNNNSNQHSPIFWTAIILFFIFVFSFIYYRYRKQP